jgi:hypothetical protein
LLSKVSIDQKQKKSSVEELNNENSVCDKLCLFRFSIISDINNELNDEKSKNIVDSDNQVLNSTASTKAEIVIPYILVANFYVFYFKVHHLSAISLITIDFTIALKSTGKWSGVGIV